MMKISDTVLRVEADTSKMRVEWAAFLLAWGGLLISWGRRARV